MSTSCCKRAAWFLIFLAAPMLLPLAAKDRAQAPTPEGQPESPEVTSIINRVIANEAEYDQKLRSYSPRVETYIQYYQPDNVLGDVVREDGHFLGRLKFEKGATEVSFTNSQSPVDFFRHLPGILTVLKAHLHLDAFAVEPLTVDQGRFDREHYTFEPVRWEYLGDIRCLAIDVHPREHTGMGAFQGRIWVEDHNYQIVRLNGTRVHPARWSFYVHFDCWRENLQPGVWLPVYVYSQETDMGKRLRFKGESRLWGYDLTAPRQQQEWTNILVDAQAPVRDDSAVTSDFTPVESERRLTMDAERNVLDRLEKARLIAPPGPVDKVLETVVNNLRVTNHLENLPPVHCRVMLSLTLESFSLAYTIALSRGLIDVLPDEPSLAMVLAHELAHIALGHKLNTKYAFNDRLEVSDDRLLSTLDLARDRQDEEAADAKGIEFLKQSPYKDQLMQAGLFLRACVEAAPRVPNMFGSHLGNSLLEGNKLVRMNALISAAPALAPTRLDQIAALPLGSRLQVNAWDGSIAFTTRKAVPIVDATEKLSFQVTPLIPYLRVYTAPAPKPEVRAQK